MARAQGRGGRNGWPLALAAVLLVSACMSSGDARLTARLGGAAKATQPLPAGRVSTKSGEILILEPDGSVTTMPLDSAGGRDAFEVTEADLAALNSNLGLDLRKLPPEDPAGVRISAVTRRGPTAQDRAIEAFRARTRPTLPRLPAELELDPALFAGVTIAPLDARARKGDAGGLVEVRARLRRGVDAEVAFAYATCALAGWAATSGAPYARHVRTLQARDGGGVRLASVFTLSDSAPLGLRVMETRATTGECKTRGIPAA